MWIDCYIYVMLGNRGCCVHNNRPLPWYPTYKRGILPQNINRDYIDLLSCLMRNLISAREKIKRCDFYATTVSVVLAYTLTINTPLLSNYCVNNLDHAQLQPLPLPPLLLCDSDTKRVLRTRCINKNENRTR